MRRRAGAAAMPFTAARYSRNSSALRFGYTPKSCGKYPSTCAARRDPRATSPPFHKTLPDVGCVIVARIRIRRGFARTVRTKQPQHAGTERELHAVQRAYRARLAAIFLAEIFHDQLHEFPFRRVTLRDALVRVRSRARKSLRKCMLTPQSAPAPTPLLPPKTKSINLRYFISWLKASVIGCVGMDLNDLPASKSCWSSTLFSHVAKLTFSDTIAARIVRVMEMAS